VVRKGDEIGRVLPRATSTNQNQVAMEVDEAVRVEPAVGEGVARVEVRALGEARGEAQ